MSGKESLFLYSSTKPITCTAALQLYEAGEFLLNDPVSKYLPEFRNRKVIRCSPNGDQKIVPAENEITVFHLFTMSSGLNYDLNSPAISAAIRKTCGKAPLSEVVNAIAMQPLDFEPGSHWRYSLSHDVLGALIETITGQTLGCYLAQNILEPLGMSHTGFHCSEKVGNNMMAQYSRRGLPPTAVRVPLKNEYILGSEYESGGAGLISTVEDYSCFTAAMANGGKSQTGISILSSETIDLMRSDHVTSQQKKDFPWPYLQGYGYGLGVRTMVNPVSMGMKGSTGTFGWCGANGNFSLMDPSTGISLFFAQQMRCSDEKYLYDKLQNLLYSCI